MFIEDALVELLNKDFKMVALYDRGKDQLFTYRKSRKFVRILTIWRFSAKNNVLGDFRNKFMEMCEMLRFKYL